MPESFGEGVNSEVDSREVFDMGGIREDDNISPRAQGGNPVYQFYAVGL
jgi:hypothetical protein